MQVRLATVNDAETISILNADVQKLHADALPHFFKQPSHETFPPSVAIELIARPDSYFLIGHIDDRAIGYIYAEVRNLPETASCFATTHLYIHHIAIDPRHRHNGYAKKLIQAIESLAHDRGITTIALDVWSFNTNAYNFFTQQGFRNFNERMWIEIA